MLRYPQGGSVCKNITLQFISSCLWSFVPQCRSSMHDFFIQFCCAYIWRATDFCLIRMLSCDTTQPMRRNGTSPPSTFFAQRWAACLKKRNKSFCAPPNMPEAHHFLVRASLAVPVIASYCWHDYPNGEIRILRHFWIAFNAFRRPRYNLKHATTAKYGPFLMVFLKCLLLGLMSRCEVELERSIGCVSHFIASPNLIKRVHPIWKLC